MCVFGALCHEYLSRVSATCELTWTVLIEMAQRKWARENSAAETPGGGKDLFLL